MSSCELAIRLERPERTWRPGEEVRGRVVVDAGKDIPKGDLLLEHFWRTHGRGNTDRGAVEHEVLHSGGWTGDSRTEHTFSFTAPEGPCTYHGNYLNVDWYVRARADLPWKLDPKAEEEFLLLPAGPAGHPVDPRPFEGAGLSNPRRGCLFVMGIVFTCVGGSTGLGGAGAFLGALGEGGRVEFELFALFPALFGFVFAAAGLWMLFSSVRQWIARRKLRDLSVRLDRTRLRPGGEVDVAVHLRPSGELRVNRISARVRGVERCTSGSGTNKTTHTHTLHDLDYVLLDETSVGEGRAIDCGETMEIPADAPPSFKASSNVLEWSVTVKIALKGWPDWEQEYGLEVVG